jgi:hypothetical protein
MAFGGVLGATGALVPGGLAASDSSTYSDEYDSAIMWTYCGGFAGLLVGGLIGFFIGDQFGTSKGDKKYSFYRLTKLEKLRTIQSIAGVTVRKRFDPTKIKTTKTIKFKTGCSGGNMRGCFNLGVAYRDGVDVPMDKLKATEFFKKSCDGAFMKGCYNLAMMYLGGVGVGVDLEKAKALFNKACLGGIARACGKLAPPEIPPPTEPKDAEARSEKKLVVLLTCPDGAEVVGKEVTGGTERFCARKAGEGEDELVRHGPTVVFDRYGDKIAEGSYAEGAKHGKWKHWYLDGTVKLEAEYKNGLEVGTWIYYSESGKESSRVEYGEQESGTRQERQR